jgi:hypothetical protein
VLRVFKIILLSVAQKMTVQHAAQDDSKWNKRRLKTAVGLCQKEYFPRKMLGSLGLFALLRVRGVAENT